MLLKGPKGFPSSSQIHLQRLTLIKNAPENKEAVVPHSSQECVPKISCGRQNTRSSDLYVLKYFFHDLWLPNFLLHIFLSCLNSFQRNNSNIIKNVIFRVKSCLVSLSLNHPFDNLHIQQFHCVKNYIQMAKMFIYD